MSQDYSTRLSLLQAAVRSGFKQPIKRGIEREALRIEPNGKLAITPHPDTLGSALTHPLVTTDYAESLLEFITPVSSSMDELFDSLRDIHKLAVDRIGDERLWPMSMPCNVRDDDRIQLAQYGRSNIGRMKTLYREGLRQRYGSTMQIISGVHYNFSLPESFWEQWQSVLQDRQPLNEFISDQYMGLIRNFYRYGWLIPYWFGASPALCRTFLQGLESSLRFESLGMGTIYLPYATSLRMSDLGYTSNAQSTLPICYNSLDAYIDSVRDATQTHSPEFARIGVKVDGEYRQLNDNILQIENELYAPIRAKRVAKPDQTPSQALKEGIEYIEIRALDVNPFAPEGITPSQVHCIDSLLLWCLMMPSPPITNEELVQSRSNYNLVATSGRDPAQELSIQGETKKIPEWVQGVMEQLYDISLLFGVDAAASLSELDEQVQKGQTLSARVLDSLQAQDLDNGLFALALAQQHHQALQAYSLTTWGAGDFDLMVKRSREEQQQIEQTDSLDFDAYLQDYFKRAIKNN